MSESSGDGPARRQGGIEPERNQTGSERTPDQHAATPVRPAPEPPAWDADGAAAPAADEPAREPGIDQKAQPERPPDRADEAPEPIEHADPDTDSRGDGEPEREPAGDAKTEREPGRTGDRVRAGGRPSRDER